MRKTNPANALFPKIRQEILAAVYWQPEKWWFMSELARFIGAPSSSLQRELESLSESAILRKKRDGNRVYFQAERDSPIYTPLRELIVQTTGILRELETALFSFDSRVSCAFIFGSVARETERTNSDVDLMIIGMIGLSDIAPTIRRLEKRFKREINVICYSAEEFSAKMRADNHFLTNVLSREKIFLIGDKDELERLTG